MERLNLIEAISVYCDDENEKLLTSKLETLDNEGLLGAYCGMKDIYLNPSFEKQNA